MNEKKAKLNRQIERLVEELWRLREIGGKMLESGDILSGEIAKSISTIENAIEEAKTYDHPRLDVKI